MRNRWGVEVKRGHWIMAHGPRGGTVEGRVEKVETRGEFARAYGARVVLDTGSTVGVDDVVQTLGPMKVGRGGVVTQNPLSRVKVGSKSQRTKAAPTKRLRARRRVTERAPAGFYGNPLARVEVDSPSQRAHLSPRGKLTTKPDARLIKRRTKTAKTRVKGVWANPAAKIAYLVFSAASDGIKHELLAHFPKKSAAVQYAQAWADMTGKRAVVESKKL